MRGIKFTIFKRTSQYMEIDDINAPWYFVENEDGVEGWVYSWYIDVND